MKSPVFFGFKSTLCNQTVQNLIRRSDLVRTALNLPMSHKMDARLTCTRIAVNHLMGHSQVSSLACVGTIGPVILAHFSPHHQLKLLQ